MKRAWEMLKATKSKCTDPAVTTERSQLLCKLIEKEWAKVIKTKAREAEKGFFSPYEPIFFTQRETDENTILQQTSPATQ